MDNLTSGISVFLYLRQPFISSEFNYFSKNSELVEITKKEFGAFRNNKERMQFSPPLLLMITETWLLRSYIETSFEKSLSTWGKVQKQNKNNLTMLVLPSHIPGLH